MPPSYIQTHSHTSQSSPPRGHRKTASAATLTSSAPASNRHRRRSLPFSFPPLFQSNASSTSLVPSTAEGKPIPVDDSTAQNRTSALRELNSNFPSRHRYAQSTGAQSSTFNQPIIVRSYYGPAPTHSVSTTQGVIVVNSRHHRSSSSLSTGPAALVRRVLPFTSGITSSGNGMLSAMAKNRTKKQFDTSAEAKLPSVDAFRFKSFMAAMDDPDGGTDINDDLDRIAEICAKSRYSLSNQYEVHYAPHGSGSSFLPGSRQSQDTQGPTLQAVSSDDERTMKCSTGRPRGIRRNSRAMGTLETIMSSSRSSEEDKSKKKSAAELAEEVRGRSIRKGSRHGSSASSSDFGQEESAVQEGEAPTTPAVIRTPRTRRSGSLALIDGARLSMHLNDVDSPKASGTGLVGEPAQPQTSNSHLEIRTTPGAPRKDAQREQSIKPLKTKPMAADGLDLPMVHGSVSAADHTRAGSNIMSALSDWMNWRSPNPLKAPAGRAEGSLRELLKSTDVKGKGVDLTA